MTDRVTVVLLAKEGYTVPEIAKKCRCTVQNVRFHLKNANIRLPRARRKDGKLYGKIPRVIAWAQKHGVCSAARRYRCTRQAIYLHMRALREAGGK